MIDRYENLPPQVLASLLIQLASGHDYMTSTGRELLREAARRLDDPGHHATAVEVKEGPGCLYLYSCPGCGYTLPLSLPHHEYTCPPCETRRHARVVMVMQT